MLLTSGPTREHLDPIRFMTNASSGRMGFALAAAALRRGARVTVISGPVEARAPKGVRLIPVVSASEMLKKTLAEAPKADVLIGAAAVGDWRFRHVSTSKLKRRGPIRLSLAPNRDILAEVGRRPFRPAVVVGFALETTRLLENALKKLRSKNLDLIVANGAESLGAPRTSLTLIWRSGKALRLAPMDKARAALRIVDEAAALLEAPSPERDVLLSRRGRPRC
ncbi:MAG: hypothetical protein HY922_12430 [Elusimicrobia bacterium]|nr:hypothetical protein [Elusimicrobiota bacterium]